ncbi:MAG: carbohydrate porin [Stellaceae bacterium]
MAPQQILAEPDLLPPLDTPYDRYLADKEALQNRLDLEYSVELSLLPQADIPKRGAAPVDFVWSPSLVWKPFTDTVLGSGAFAFSMQQNQFWTGTNASAYRARLGVLTPPGDWFINTTDYAQLTYTHTLPGEWRFLSATIGQYSFGTYDANQYAGNAQTSFINYALAQNATQTYVSGDLGAYVQAAAPRTDLVLAGGFQGATDLAGTMISARGIASGKDAYFAAARWTPHLLAGGSYGFLWYLQPAVAAQQLTRSRGLSVNAAQNLDSAWGLFLRANTASGHNNPIAASLGWGIVRNDPFAHDPLDQAGIGIAWNRTNPGAVGEPARNAEWVVEAYYDYTVFKGLQIAPDIQLYPRPALASTRGSEAVLTLRATAIF